MTRDEWRQVEPVLTKAVLLPEKDRDALLDTAGLEREVRRGIQELLQRTFLRSSAAVGSGSVATLTSTKWTLPRLEPDQVVLDGRYRVLNQIGRGGMGAVYLAQDRKLATRVALKVVPPDERLLAEARRTAVCFGHPHVVGILDVFSCVTDEQSFGMLVMEYVDGSPASRILAEGPVETLCAVRWARQVASAIAHAHDQQVLHCDLKPGNIMIAKDQRAKVLDFGIARATFDSESEPVRGTLPYMAPEQLSHGEYSEAGDVYSLGVTLFELVSGRRPFVSQGEALRIEIVMVPAPRLSEFVPHLAPELEAIVERALAKNPAERFRSARALERELAAINEPTQSVVVVGPATAPVQASGAPAYAMTAFGAVTLLMLLGFVTSRALETGIGQTGTFRTESPLMWPVWGLKTLFAPFVGVVMPLLVLSVTVASVLRLLSATSRGERLLLPLSSLFMALRRRLHRIPRPGRAQLLVLAQVTALVLLLSEFRTLLSSIITFMNPEEAGSLAELRPENEGTYGMLRRLLSVELFLFGLTWWNLLRGGVKDIMRPAIAGAGVAIVTLFFFAVPYRVLNHNEFRRVSYGNETCYLTAEGRAEVVLFCPHALPRTRIIDANDEQLKRSSAVENIFSTLDSPTATPAS